MKTRQRGGMEQGELGTTLRVAGEKDESEGYGGIESGALDQAAEDISCETCREEVWLMIRGLST